MIVQYCRWLYCVHGRCTCLVLRIDLYCIFGFNLFFDVLVEHGAWIFLLRYNRDSGVFVDIQYGAGVDRSSFSA